MARWLAFLWSGVIAFLLTLPASELPALPSFVPHVVARYADKGVHLGLFAIMTLLIAEAGGGLRAYWTIALVTAYGGLLEVVQGWIPGRDPSWGDLAADCAGAVLAVAIWHWLVRRRRRKVNGHHGPRAASNG